MNRKQRRATQSSLPMSGKRLARAKQREPSSAQGHNELGCQLLLQGHLEEAASHFAHALTLMPDLFEQQYAHLVATLLNVNPAICAGMARVLDAWPRSSGIAAIARDPMLRCMLESATVHNLDLERYLTAVRRIILSIASDATKSGNAVKHSVL